MCRVFSVSRSGYYRWRRHAESRRTIENRRLDAHIKAIFNKHKARYGSPKITDELNDMGFPVSKNRVARRMKQPGFVRSFGESIGRPPIRSIPTRSLITFCSVILRPVVRTGFGSRTSPTSPQRGAGFT